MKLTCHNDHSKKNIINFSLLLVVPLMLYIVSCDNTVDPLDEEKGIYSIYGAIDMNADQNYIRVKDLNLPMRDGEIVDFNGEVTFMHIESQTTELLRDTVINFNEIYVRNFKTTMEINAESQYQVTAQRNDSRKVSSIATTPNIASVTVEPKEIDCQTMVTSKIGPIFSGKMQVNVGFWYDGNIYWVPQQDNNPLVVEEYELSFTPLDILDEVFYPDTPFGRQGRRVWCHELSSANFIIRFIHYGPDFFEDTSSDTLQIPGGAGNFGAFYEEEYLFEVDT